MFDELGESVFRRRFESLDLNIGVVAGEDGLLVIDTRASHLQADELIDELGQVSPLPVRWVINTHWHWDHTFGNSRFGDAEIWGHELCRETLLHRGDEMREVAKKWFPPEYQRVIDEVDIVSPTRTFSDRASLSIGRRVEMSYHGLGHTNADIIIVVPDAGVAFMGDLIEESAPPVFGDSYPVVWPLTLRLAMKGLPDTIVPGHGDVVDRQFAMSQHEELVAVAELATACVSGELSIDEAIHQGPYQPDVMRSAMERAIETGH